MKAKRRTSSPHRRPRPVATASKQPKRSRASAATRDAARDSANFYASLLATGDSSPFLLSHPEDAKITNLIKLIATEVLEYVRPRFERDPLGELLRPEHVVVTTMPHATVQAVTVWVAPKHAIVVNLGLMLFMYRLGSSRLTPHHHPWQG